MRLINQFWRSQSGATAIEYALIASILGVGLVIALGHLGGRISAEFSEVSGVLK